MSFEELKNLMAATAMSKEEIETYLSVPRMAKMTTVGNGKSAS